MEQKSSTTGGGTLHNIAEKIKHPLSHNTKTNTTYETREQKKLSDKDPTLAAELGAKDVGVPSTNPLSSRTTTTVSSKDAMLNQPNVPTTHSTIAREEYEEKKW